MLAKTLVFCASLGLVVTAGCSSNTASPGGAQSALPMVRPATGNPVSQYISHVVVIVQENRSFENFFAGYPGANAPMYGCAPATLRARGVSLQRPVPLRKKSGSGCPSGDKEVPLTPVTFDSWDIKHDWDTAIAEWNNGNMDGFYKYGQQHTEYAAYSYVQQSDISPYWNIAQNWVLADEMFPTEFGGSFTGHLTLVAGTDDLTPDEAEVDFPNGTYDDCDSAPGTKSSYVDNNRVVHRFKGPFPCFNQWVTMAQDLDNSKVSWKYYATQRKYAGMWEPYEAMKYVRYGPDWKKDIIAPQTRVITDAQNGNLASVDWVTPSKQDSDHPAYHSNQGPAWVASVVNAIGESKYWPTTAIIVVWDDWGGWNDNAAPPQLDYRGLGMRVPCLIISPYARLNSSSKPGYVSHTQYEFGSILKFMEEAFNLESLQQIAGSYADGYTDQRANSIDDAFDFTQQPRSFTPIPTKFSIEHFKHEPPSNEPVDTE